MEEEKISTPTGSPESQVCKHCGMAAVEQGYAAPLCENCRTALSKKPLPWWIKGFSAVVLVLLAYALYHFPASIASGVDYERGRKAEKEKKYATAVRIYEKVAGKYSDSTVVLARLFMAYYHNGDFEKAYEINKKIAGRKLSDRELIKEVNGTLARLETLYLHKNDLNSILSRRNPDDPSANEKMLRNYVEKYPDDVSGSFYLANALYNLKKYDQAEGVMLAVMKKNPDFCEGNLFMAAIYREKGLYDQGLEYARKSLAYNVEDARAFVAMSRIELKRHNDRQGLGLAQQASAIDAQNAQVIANLAIAFHFNGMIKERDEAFTRLKNSQEYSPKDLEFLTSIFSGENKWRD